MEFVDELIDKLREHAVECAGGSSSESNYDPDTLVIEMEAADVLEVLWDYYQGRIDRGDVHLRMLDYER